MDSATGARDWLCAPEAEVSAHYLVDRDGTVWQLVDEDLRAWHAGAGAWDGQGDVNSRSIGIELVNTGTEPFAEPLMRALEALLPGILARWAIPPGGVIAHSDMAPGRKIDPGPRFDWARLARGGLALWPAAGPPGPPEDPDPARFAARLTAIGYPEADPATRLAAFRLRTRHGTPGPLDATDMDLARRWLVLLGKNTHDPALSV